VRDVFGNEAIDFEEFDTAAEAEFAPARRERSDEIDFVVSGIDHRAVSAVASVSLARSWVTLSKEMTR
jgi:hypothetical protein